MKIQKIGWVLGLSIMLPVSALAGFPVTGVPGDFDNDCDVDATDFQHFRMCALGAAVAQTNPLCADARLDADTDVT